MKVIAIIAVLIASLVSSTAAIAQYKRLPATGDSWYWEIGPPVAGLVGLPATSAAYPSPGSATIWDTDLFEDSNRSSGGTLRIPTGPSPVVSAIHAAGHYSICYVEVGAYQTSRTITASCARSSSSNSAPGRAGSECADITSNMAALTVPEDPNIHLSAPSRRH